MEAVITAILLGKIMTLIDDGNSLPCGPLAPLIGLLIAMIGGAMGPLASLTMNPAHDFGPKLMTFFCRLGEAAFTADGTFPIFWSADRPVLGTCIGAAGYKALICKHLLALGG